MSERKCSHCTRPAEFLCAMCADCNKSNRKSAKKRQAKRMRERAARKTGIHTFGHGTNSIKPDYYQGSIT